MLEPLGGYLLLGAKLSAEPTKYGGAWNFGPHAEDNKTVGDLVAAAIQIWGSGEYNYSILANQPHEAGLLKLDISKATTALHWSPKYDSQTAIAETLNWYKKYFENPSQIAAYTSKAVSTYASL
ncbi:MAG: hypothetical protein EOO61_23005 [Hymenobacter sp.]|nr:MAG: hypothetical protein EOO61_23005 [Hymenobacter sp.]